MKSTHCLAKAAHRMDSLDRHCIVRFDADYSVVLGGCAREVESVDDVEEESRSSLWPILHRDHQKNPPSTSLRFP